MDKMGQMKTLPPCGLYRTTKPLEHIKAGALVYFHNHGDPGPGLYLPSSWAMNRVQWSARGTTLIDAAYADSLRPLPAEGLYCVRESFFCCEKQCLRLQQNQLVQLGYDGQAQPILFVPEWSSRGLGFPERGTRLDEAQLDKLSLLTVAQGADSPKDAFIH